MFCIVLFRVFVVFVVFVAFVAVFLVRSLIHSGVFYSLLQSHLQYMYGNRQILIQQPAKVVPTPHHTP